MRKTIKDIALAVVVLTVAAFIVGAASSGFDYTHGLLTLLQRATSPSNPAGGNMTLFCRTNGRIATRTAAGVESDLATVADIGAPGGTGDMEKATYDQDDNGVVDSVDAVRWSTMTETPTSYDQYGLATPVLAEADTLASVTARGETATASINIPSGSSYKINGTPLAAADVGAVPAPGSPAQGQVLYNDGSGWAALAPGDAGKILQTNGGGANPSWETAAGGSGDSLDLLLFGDGSDGDVTISSGTTTLTRDMAYDDLTISGTGSLACAGYTIRVKGTLDISSAPAGAIVGISGGAGQTPANLASYAVGGTIATGVTVGNSIAGIRGRAGAATAGTNGEACAAPKIGNIGGEGGNGGAGSGGWVGGTAQTNAASGNWPFYLNAKWLYVSNSTFAVAAGGGGGGSSGGGDNTNKGGAGGSGGGGGGSLFILANTIARGASTAADAIATTGGTGGTGLEPSAGNCGGAAGGGGGAGGYIVVVYRTLSGSQKAGAISANAGAGGNGTNGIGTGTAGTGGTGGTGGVVILYDVTANTGTLTSGAAGSGPTGTTGGGGGACSVAL